MIFLSDIQGTIKAIVPDKIYQGSANAKEFVLLAPFPETSAVSVSITLPNGQLIVPKILIPTTPEETFQTSYKLSLLPNFSFKADGVSLYNAWRMELKAPITQYSGELSVQFIIATGNGVIETTSSENINIDKGTPYIMPENVNDWSQVLESIQEYQAQMKEALDNLKEELNEKIDNNAEDINVLQEKDVYDYVITKAEDFTTEKLSTMSGRVLVKGVNIPANNGTKRTVEIPKDVKYISFIDCLIYADLRGAVLAPTQIVGFIGDILYENGKEVGWCSLSLFRDVEYCKGNLILTNCYTVSNSEIRRAGLCRNICNVTVTANNVNDDYYVFSGCSEITNVIIYSEDNKVLKISYCTGLSNIIKSNGDFNLQYILCHSVNGDTCDDYYSAEDVGKVQVITADGTKQTAAISSLTSDFFERGQAPNSIQQKGTGAKSLGDNCLAFNNSIAGCLGYRYKAIDLKNRKIYLTTQEIPVINGLPQIAFTTTGFADDSAYIENITLPYNRGDNFTLKTRGIDFDNVGTIIAINKNVVTFASGTKLDQLTANDVIREDAYVDRYSFSVPTKPDKGEVVVSENATAFGVNCKAPGRNSFTAGRDNKAIGDDAILLGRGLTGGYQAFVAGYSCYGKAANFTWGNSCNNKGPWSAVFGYRNYTYHSDYEDPAYCFVAGTENAARLDGSAIWGLCNGQTARKAQTILGQGAQYQGYSKALFLIGNGEVRKNSDGTYTANEDKRSNAFVVWEDGRATILKDPTEPMDVVPKHMYDALLARVQALEAKL